MKSAVSIPGIFMHAAQKLIRKYFAEWGEAGRGPTSDGLFSADAVVNWNGREFQGGELKSFFENRNYNMKFKIASYDVQPVNEYQPPFCLVVVTGAVASSSEPSAQFHSTFYVEIGDGESMMVHHHTIQFL